MSTEHPRDDREQIDIVYELPPSAKGTYRCERPDGTTVHGDASGEWTLDKNGDLEDIVFFAAPRLMGYGRKPSSGTPSLSRCARVVGLLAGERKPEAGDPT